MSTVQEILVKDSWNEDDIKVLFANVSVLPISALVKLGLAPATKPIEAVKEPVKDVPSVSGVVKAAQMITKEQSLPPVKKRGSSKKVVK